MKRNLHVHSPSPPSRAPALFAVMLVACCALMFGAGCEDRLPSQVSGPAPIDTSDNMFVLDGDGYQHAVFSFSRRSATAYFFSDDSLTSILNAERIIGPSGRQMHVVVNISVPGLASGSYQWEDGVVDPAAKSLVRVAIDNVEYLSVYKGGSTQVFFTLDPVSRKVRGGYSGILESRAGKQVRLSSGRFEGGFF
jgi:hypothetical protein